MTSARIRHESEWSIAQEGLFSHKKNHKSFETSATIQKAESEAVGSGGYREIYAPCERLITPPSLVESRSGELPSSGQVQGSRAHIFIYNIVHSDEDYGTIQQAGSRPLLNVSALEQEQS
jgi:hypothetical protein